MHLNTFLHKFIELLYSFHRSVSVHQSPTLAFSESVSDTLSNCNEQPRVTEFCLTHFSTKECICQARRQMLIQVVPLINLIWFKQEFLIQQVKPASETVRLLRKFGREKIGQEHNLCLSGREMPHTHQTTY